MKATPKTENLAYLVRFVRGEKVLLDFDLAQLYGVETRALNQAVKRNLHRFPEDFMFQLSPEEAELIQGMGYSSATPSPVLRPNSSQTVMSSPKHRGRKYVPYAFTEQGVAMLSSVLRSPRSRSEYCHYANLRPTAPPDGFQSRFSPQD
jgi:hypothetical protein